MTTKTAGTTAALVLVAMVGLYAEAEPQAAGPGKAVRKKTPMATSAQLEAIRSAQDASAAVEAYAAAINVAPDDPHVYETYVKKMLDLHMVDALSRPAAKLTRLDPSAGVGWSVTAFFKARKGDMADAFAEEMKALKSSPNDPFTLQLAGQLVAWYSHADKSKITARITRDVLSFREHRDRAAYQAGFRDANEAYTQKNKPAVVSPTIPPTSSPGGYNSYYYPYTTYSFPQYDYPYDYYYYTPPYPYYYLYYPQLFFGDRGERGERFFDRYESEPREYREPEYYEERHRYTVQPGQRGPVFSEQHERTGHLGSPGGPVFSNERHEFEHFGSPNGPVISHEHHYTGRTERYGGGFGRIEPRIETPRTERFHFRTPSFGGERFEGRRLGGVERFEGGERGGEHFGGAERGGGERGEGEHGGRR